MLTIEELSKIIDQKPLWILDGAVGTELERLGYQTHLPLWTATANAEVPALIQQIHMRYAAAGADILTANTFRTSYYTYKKTANEEGAILACKQGVQLAREVSEQTDQQTLIAASLAPLEDCYLPQDTPPDEILSYYHAKQLDLLFETEADFVLAETMNSKREAMFIARYCHEQSIPLMISLITNGKGSLLSGESLQEVIRSIRNFDPIAILLNCRPLQTITSDLQHLVEYYRGRTGIYANAPGAPDIEGNWQPDKNDIPSYCRQAQKWKEMGVQIIGGCCGTQPDYIQALSKLMISSSGSRP